MSDEAQTLVRHLREKVNHSMNLERTFQQMPAEIRSAIPTLTRKARAGRCGDQTLAALLNGCGRLFFGCATVLCQRDDL